ncbi:iron-containing alcohol dehydrogenase [Pseudomonas sp. LS44]|uniref:iron-containing alcohol dehydrogenase n=1 Tax=Pseudomonas sp. LS44 TaxID=1357074 RepID=UPI00215AB837|nr:iron-containing alcohol dehydrogenase [Pseudomonas sp. LS44]UVE16696.1 iron-containing alcohol dehydrogenase [Pseudomonas sp. LS44]
MRSFTFFNPTRLHFGAGQIARLSEEIPASARILVTHGGASIFQNGVWQQVQDALSGYRLSRFAGIEANPQFATLLRGLEQARSSACDFILAIGGGSVIDGSKFIAAALCHDGDPLELLTGTPITAALPLGCVVTLAATGSESNGSGLVSHAARQEKLAFSSPLLCPRFAILDPNTTFSLPPRLISNGVIDAFVHTLEYYLTYSAHAPLQDRYAEALLRTLIEEGPLALASPASYGARANLMLCANQAMNGLLGCGMPQDRPTHLIGRELAALYHIDHAQTLAVIFPALLGEYRAAYHAKLLQYAERVWDFSRGDPEARVDAALNATRDFFRRLGAATQLGELGLDAAAIEQILAQLKRHGVATLDEQAELDLTRCERILLRAL